jgi:hypothetical protein
MRVMITPDFLHDIPPPPRAYRPGDGSSGVGIHGNRAASRIAVYQSASSALLRGKSRRIRVYGLENGTSNRFPLLQDHATIFHNFPPTSWRFLALYAMPLCHRRVLSLSATSSNGFRLFRYAPDPLDAYASGTNAPCRSVRPHYTISKRDRPHLIRQTKLIRRAKTDFPHDVSARITDTAGAARRRVGCKRPEHALGSEQSGRAAIMCYRRQDAGWVNGRVIYRGENALNLSSIPAIVVPLFRHT